MAKQRNQQRERNMVRLESEIARQNETIVKLHADGHPCPDAQRQLDGLKEAVSLLR